ncbi:MAG: Fe2+-dependent dioxygenase [Proteobacteria bacterium]|nr:Fe2+-dependent dioxygenase [Pseudomonadota bacterium]
MILVIPDVLSDDQVKQVRAKLTTVKFVDGAQTAGAVAKQVKNNLQADMNTPEYGQLNSWILPIIGNNQMFETACMPLKFTRVRFSRYRDNMTYGAHIDEPMMGEIRTDISFTLFLAEPEDYAGGELIMHEAGGDRAFKLRAGHMIAYPSTTLHRVAPVTQGERLVAFGWAQSLVRDAAHRETLFDLSQARMSLLERPGCEREGDLVAKSRSNLLRMWAEP